MFVPHKDLNFRNLTTEFFLRGEDRKRRCLVEEEERAGKYIEITTYGIPLYPVISFKYLGRVLSEEDGDCPLVVRILWRAWQKWDRLTRTRVLSREGTYAQTLGQIHLAMVQSAMIYGSDTWVMKPHMGRFLGGLHHRVDHRMTGRQPRRGQDGFWVYLPLKDAMAEAGL